MADVDKVKSILGTEIIGKDGNQVAPESLIGQDKILGLYFSAHWCPPCRNFTPVLIEFYKQIKPTNPNFEIIFFSRDKDEEAFKDYYKDMPWLAVPLSNTEHTQKIMGEFGIRGIPTFVLLNGSTGEVINPNARQQVTSNPGGFPWL